MSLWWFNTFFAALKCLKELVYILRTLSVLVSCMLKAERRTEECVPQMWANTLNLIDGKTVMKPYKWVGSLQWLCYLAGHSNPIPSWNPLLYVKCFFLHCTCSGICLLLLSLGRLVLQKTRLGWRSKDTILCFCGLCGLYLLYCQKENEEVSNIQCHQHCDLRNNTYRIYYSLSVTNI